MNQTPSLWRVISAIWLQNFKQNPIATVGGTTLMALILVGLVFVSAFFTVGFLVLGGVLFISNWLFGFTRRHQAGPSHRHADKTMGSPPDVIEGDFHVVDDDSQNTKFKSHDAE